MANDEDHDFQVSDSLIIRVGWVEYKGRAGLDIREHYWDEDTEEWRPGKGIRIRKDQVEDFIPWLSEMLEMNGEPPEPKRTRGAPRDTERAPARTVQRSRRAPEPEEPEEEPEEQEEEAAPVRRVARGIARDTSRAPVRRTVQRSRREEPEEEPAPSRRTRKAESEPEEKPVRRTRKVEPEPEEKPARRGRARVNVGDDWGN